MTNNNSEQQWQT